MDLTKIRNSLQPVLADKRIRKIVKFIEACKYADLQVWDHSGANRQIYDALMSDKPAAIGKLGSTELQALRNYLRYKNDTNWEQKLRVYGTSLYTYSGVYPDHPLIYRQFCEYFLEDVLPKMTHIVVWFNISEAKITKKYSQPHVPFLSVERACCLPLGIPMTRALAGRNILVVHPFVNTISHQYSKRNDLWSNPKDFLPQFNLDTLRVPHYPVLVPPEHENWFATLNALKAEMAKRTFDVALIGAGAYSLPLTVYAKSLGKQAIHLGGSTQFYFGIKGNRWDNNGESRFYNKYWIRPLPEDTPPNNSLIEDGCYW